MKKNCTNLRENCQHSKRITLLWQRPVPVDSQAYTYVVYTQHTIHTCTYLSRCQWCHFGFYWLYRFDRVVPPSCTALQYRNLYSIHIVTYENAHRSQQATDSNSHECLGSQWNLCTSSDNTTSPDMDQKMTNVHYTPRCKIMLSHKQMN